MRAFLCSIFGHRKISYTEAPYDDCTRCGAQLPIGRDEAISRLRARVVPATRTTSR